MCASRCAPSARIVRSRAERDSEVLFLEGRGRERTQRRGSSEARMCRCLCRRVRRRGRRRARLRLRRLRPPEPLPRRPRAAERAAVSRARAVARRSPSAARSSLVTRAMSAKRSRRPSRRYSRGPGAGMTKTCPSGLAIGPRCGSGVRPAPAGGDVDPLDGEADGPPHRGPMFRGVARFRASRQRQRACWAVARAGLRPPRSA